MKYTSSSIGKQKRQKLANLLRATGEAHHEVFTAAGGEDPDWAARDSQDFAKGIAAEMDLDIGVAGLEPLLVVSERQRNAQALKADWPAYYAEILLNELDLYPDCRSLK